MQYDCYVCGLGYSEMSGMSYAGFVRYWKEGYDQFKPYEILYQNSGLDQKQVADELEEACKAMIIKSYYGPVISGMGGNWIRDKGIQV